MVSVESELSVEPEKEEIGKRLPLEMDERGKLAMMSIAELRNSKLRHEDSSPLAKKSVSQLFTRLTQEIQANQPKDVIHFIVDFLCRHYPEHLHGFGHVWNGDPDLMNDRISVVQFFKFNTLPLEVASHFTNAGFDTLETLATLTTDSLVEIENFSKADWLPGHKIRLQQIFGDIVTYINAYKESLNATHSLQPYHKVPFPMSLKI